MGDMRKSVREASGLKAAREIASRCTGVRLRMLGRVVSGLYDDALRPHGLRVGQLNILVFVTLKENASPKEIARDLCMEKSTLSRNLERMESRGWIARHEAEKGRGLTVVPTAAGLRVLGKVLPAWRSAQESVRDLLGEKGVTEVDRLARRVGRLEDR